MVRVLLPHQAGQTYGQDYQPECELDGLEDEEQEWLKAVGAEEEHFGEVEEEAGGAEDEDDYVFSVTAYISSAGDLGMSLGCTFQ